MKIELTDSLIQDMTNEFKKSYPQHKKSFQIEKISEQEFKILLHDYCEVIRLDDLYEELEEDSGWTEEDSGWTEKDLFWLNLTNIYNTMMIIYERDHLADTLRDITHDLKKQLLRISKTVDMDMNTLWIAFQTSMEELERELRAEYIRGCR